MYKKRMEIVWSIVKHKIPNLKSEMLKIDI